ncbi:hypothetical protein HOY80DRAFT_1004213 [Tuber brumale]|nr:hypothetical protein HOY80DRAFT_1004213 [Tuber brumale]
MEGRDRDKDHPFQENEELRILTCAVLLLVHNQPNFETKSETHAFNRKFTREIIYYPSSPTWLNNIKLLTLIEALLHPSSLPLPTLQQYISVWSERNQRNKFNWGKQHNHNPSLAPFQLAILPLITFLQPPTNTLPALHQNSKYPTPTITLPPSLPFPYYQKVQYLATTPQMARRPIETVRTAKLPKHIAEIGMTNEQYFELKVHIKAIILPGTPAFEGKRFDSKDVVYRQWLNNALAEIGPRFFPKDGKGLVWPEDYKKILMAVHQVVRALGIKIKKNYRGAGMRAVEGKTGSAEVEVVREGGHYEGGDPDDTEMEEDILADEEVVWEMDAADLQLEDLLGLIQPESFAQFPDLEDEPFDWDEVGDSNTSDAMRHLANLDQLPPSPVPSLSRHSHFSTYIQHSRQRFTALPTTSRRILS